MNKREHDKRHKRLDSVLNEIVADFFDNSGIPPHLATVHSLLKWSGEQAREVGHESRKGLHEDSNVNLTEK